MAYQWLTSFKASNERKTVFLMILFPVALFLILWVFATIFVTDEYFAWNARIDIGLEITFQLFIVLVPILVVWVLIVFFFQRKIMFSFAGAKELTRAQNPEIYNIVENLCISRGLPTPKIWIMLVSGLNAFATGWRAKDSRIVFTQGLLDKLDKREIEAVAAHELTHLINKDSMLMLVTVVYIGIISLIWEIIFRSSFGWNSKSSWKGWWQVQLMMLAVGWVFLLLWYVIYPLIKLAVSRKREYLADLGSVELTKDSQAMISALQKISWHSAVPKAKKNMAMFFIETPEVSNEEIMWMAKKHKTSIRDSHPSIKERIEALQNY